ncbi:MAG: hypothetical protein JXR48_09130 [Candidatus Delongbacteria bacterium]|nr:hypothetical protein [Candidatus Delongbacteria bacterium]MBN2835114.1 hypothetical protein [Candidatus Delongbacteria bacterium]
MFKLLKKISRNKQESDALVYLSNNLPTILKNSDLILKTPEYYFVTYKLFYIASPYVGTRKLYLGDLVSAWRGNIMVSENCCGRVLIYYNTGSILSGKNNYAGICEKCGKIIRRNDLADFSKRFIYFDQLGKNHVKPEFTFTFEELIEEVS